MAEPVNNDTEVKKVEEPSDEEMAEDGGERKELVDKLMKDPQVLAALQTKLRRFLGTPSSYISVSCPFFLSIYFFPFFQNTIHNSCKSFINIQSDNFLL